MDITELISTPEAAKLLGVSTPTLLRMARRREIKHYRIGKHHKFRKQDIVNYLEKATVGE